MTYLWSNATTTSDITGLTNGNYTVTVTDVNSCSGTATVTINPLPSASISGTVTVQQNATSPDVTFTGSNGTAPYTFTYNINGGANQTISTVSGNTVSVTAPTVTPGTFNYNLVKCDSRKEIR